MATPSDERTPDEYIELFQRTLVENPDHHLRKDILHTLSTMLKTRAQNTGSMDDLNAAIKAGEEAATSTIEGDLRRGERFDNLSHALRLRASLTKSVEDVTAAIDHAMTAMGAIPRAKGSNSALVCDNWAIAMRLRSELTGNLQDIDITIFSLQHTLRQMPEEVVLERAILSTSLGNSLAERIRRSPPEAIKKTDFDLLMQARITAVELTPSSSPNFLGYQSNLATAFLERFLRTRIFKDLETAIEKLEEVVKLMPPDDPDGRMLLQNLVTCLLERQELLDSPADRNALLQALGDKLDLGVVGWDNDELDTRIMRASQLLDAFEFTDSMEDLGSVTKEFEEISGLLPPHDKRQSRVLNNLGVALTRRGQRLKSLKDIQAGIKAFEKTLPSRLMEPEQRARNLINIGSGWMTCYDWSGESFDQAFGAFEEALQLISNDSPGRKLLLGNLGSLFHMKFDKKGDLDDLRKVIKYNQEALARSKQDLNQIAGFVGLADAFRDLYKRTGSEDDLNSALQAYDEGFGCLQSSPSKRIISAMRGAYLAAPLNPGKATALFRKAIELLPNASPRTLNRDDQQHALSTFSGISSDAAMVAMNAGESVEEALRLLELGRGVMMSTELETRSDITDLHSMYPSLATPFKILRDKLGSSVPAEAGKAAASRQPNRYAISQEFDEMVKTIRNRTGFENFLLGPAASELTKLAAEGPIVYLNISAFGNGSFLITTTGIKYLPLPQLIREDAIRNVNLLSKTLYYDNAVTRRESIKVLRKILKWLWDVAVEPILQHLDFTEKPKDGAVWPHVWWIPIGALTLFPFHAAGNFSADGRNTLDRVISSYTPTTRALGYARDRVRQSRGAHNKQSVLMTVMSETPGMGPLPFCAKEAEAINTLLPESIPREILLKPTRAELWRKINECSVAHFACHGGVEHNPSKSKIYLEDWQTCPLTVGDIAALKLDHAQLAYLSACHTTSSLDYRLFDEAIHMAGACQLAGFPNVVGTLWHVSDSQSAILTEEFYRLLLDKDEKLDFKSTARALHFAMRKIRDDTSQRADDPVVWAPYIHLGV